MPANPTLNGDSEGGYQEALRRIGVCAATGSTQLTLTGLGLTALPPELGQLTALTSLYLRDNRLTELLPVLGQLTALTSLDLMSNRLTALPPELGQLTALTSLDLSDNQLTALPPELGLLTALTILRLDNNHLMAVPPELGLLTALTKLYLGNNQLTALPPELGQLSALSRLDLRGNDALRLPDELLDPERARSAGLSAQKQARLLLDYYVSRQTEGEAPLEEVRLLLVGRGRVGKTSLLKALRGERPDHQELETPGITVLPLQLSTSRGAATGLVWDFGGQEFLHGTHQIFLAERCLYLLVLEGRESNWENETDYWLRFVQSFGGDSPVIVVMAKYDAHSFSIDRFRLQERCPQIVGFVETDAFTGRGLTTLMELIGVTVEKMKDVWVGVPKKWHRVKEKLAAMPESFLSFRHFQQLCVDNGVIGEDKQDSLAQTLHRLGIALNFRDHLRLRDTSVLKPTWVTEAIYSLFRYVQAQDCHGILRPASMSEALNSVDYPQEKHAFVLDLMRKFEVAFPLEGTQDWLIPELLREEQPEAFPAFRGPDVRRLRFWYPEALPPGLLPRFIVRTHEMSKAHPEWRWRSGVVLYWEGSQALIRLNRSDRRTEVALIQAPDRDRPDLFDLIRAHLTVLHGVAIRVVEEAELEGHPDSWVGVRKLRLQEAQGTGHTDAETKDGQLAIVNVSRTLDRVESPESRAADRELASPLRLFVSYAHADENRLRPLSPHLTILGRRGYIQAWDDTQLIAGDDWKERILYELRQADIVLLLYSTASRASPFIQDTEAPEAVKMARREANPCTLIVVPLDRQDWDQTVALERDLATHQTATWNAKPVLDFSPQSKGWQEVEHSIRKAVESWRRRR